MKISCKAEQLFPRFEKLLKKLSDGVKLTARENTSLLKLLHKYWGIECPLGGKDCLPNRCSFANPIDWIEYHGYTSMTELLNHFEFEDVSPLMFKDKKSSDALDVHRLRRCGHYNP